MDLLTRLGAGMEPSSKPLLQRLFEQHRSALEAFFYRRIRTKRDAGDLAQEVYLRLLRVNRSDAIQNPEGYLYTVAANLVREYSVADRRLAAQLNIDESVLQSELVTSQELDRILDLPVRAERLQQVLRQLPAKCQMVVYLRYNEQRRYQEIASQLDISVHMVQKYLAQALSLCRRRMVRFR